MPGSAPRIAPPDDFLPFEKGEIEQSILDRFEKQVLLGPDRPAVIADGRALSYLELNRQANRIARALLARRGHDAEPVALLLNQGPDIVAAILGVLKAGKFYVPLDPLDTENQQSVLNDCGAAIAIGNQRSLSGLTPDHGREVLSIEELDGAASAENPDIAVAPDSLAYIYYTSGSTGRPKGVVDCHRNVLHNVMRYTNAYSISPSDRLTLLQPPNFSGAVSSTFSAILNGACAFPFEASRRSVSEMAEWLTANKITIYHSVPAIFRALVRTGRTFPDVRVLRLEGDQSCKADVTLFKRHFAPGCVLANGLGLTEAGLVRRFLVDHEIEPTAEILPVGYPLQDMEVRIVDQAGNAVRPGDSGEIAITSRYLAVDYWRMPELTRAKFRADPDRPEMRTYLSGDLGRMGPDGCLEYLGRSDSRVKIHGNWVDLVEVEAALHRLGLFSEVVARTWSDSKDNPRLVAYYTSNSAAEVAPDTLRQALSGALPDHMIPVRFVRLEHLPLNANGKVDRAALPPPERARPKLEQPYVEPSDILQEELARIWEELLGVAPVGIRDNFFDLGGDSFLAMTLLLEIEALCNRSVSPDVLLAGSTVEELAKAVEAELDGSSYDSACIAASEGGEKQFFFLHGDYRSHGFYCVRLARYLDRAVSMRVLAPRAPSGDALQNTVESFAAWHIEELQKVQPHGPYLLGGNCNGGAMAFEMARQLTEQGERVETLVMVRTSGRNARYWRQVHVLHKLCDGLGLSSGMRAQLATRLRWYLAALEQQRGIHKLLFPARKVAHYLSVLLRGGLRALARPELQTHSGSKAAQVDVADTYMKMVGNYVPGPYEGRTVLFWPDQDNESGEQALGHWIRNCPNLELRPLPGNHVSCITRYAETFARELATCLRGAGDGKKDKAPDGL